MDGYDHDDIGNEGDQQPPLSSFKYFLTFNRRDNQSLAILGLWATTCEVSWAIGHLYTAPNGNSLFCWFSLSLVVWLNPPVLYFPSRIRDIFQMNPSDIFSYLSINILTIGISSFTPMMYLSLDSI